MERKSTIGNVSIRDAHIIFRNFSGRESKFNRAGNRNFCVIIDDEETVKNLTEDGWNVKILQPRDPDELPKNYIQVSVSFDYYPPNVYFITGNHKNQLTEDNIDILDSADIQKVDLSFRPYQWEVNGKTGVKAYLKTMYVTAYEDEFADDYNFDSPDERPHAEEMEDMDLPF